MCWNPKYALLLLISTLITFLSGIAIYNSRGKDNRYKKWSVAISFILNIGILIIFKYGNFLIDNINRFLLVFKLSNINRSFDVLLPVGISFYTFQALSYTMDVYRGEIDAEYNFFRYALFVSFFPQLVAGPIERSKDLLMQLKEEKDFDYDQAMIGLGYMLVGFFMKVVVADRIAQLINPIYNNIQDSSGTQLFIATILFAIQIFCDFNGYSTIAFGAAKILRIELTQNFKSPYFSLSISEFWRRWHITLSTWFRDYLYIPLGGNRKGKLRKYFNIIVVFLVSGLWHGASWHYIIWGGLNGVYQVLGEVFQPLRLKVISFFPFKKEGPVHKGISRLITLLLILSTWVFFRAENMNDAISIFAQIFKQGYSNDIMIWISKNKWEWLILIISLIVLFIYDFASYRNHKIVEKCVSGNPIVTWFITFAILWFILIFGVYGSAYDATAFIYFQF